MRVPPRSKERSAGRGGEVPPGRRERRTRQQSPAKEGRAPRTPTKSRQGRNNVAHRGSGGTVSASSIKPRRGGTCRAKFEISTACSSASVCWVNPIQLSLKFVEARAKFSVLLGRPGFSPAEAKLLSVGFTGCGKTLKFCGSCI